MVVVDRKILSYMLDLYRATNTGSVDITEIEIYTYLIYGCETLEGLIL